MIYWLIVDINKYEHNNVRCSFSVPVLVIVLDLHIVPVLTSIYRICNRQRRCDKFVFGPTTNMYRYSTAKIPFPVDWIYTLYPLRNC